MKSMLRLVFEIVGAVLLSVAVTLAVVKMMQVRGLWTGEVPAERETEAALSVNDWNRDRYWPKVYTHRVEDTGVLRIRGKVGTSVKLTLKRTDGKEETRTIRTGASDGTYSQVLDGLQAQMQQTEGGAATTDQQEPPPLPPAIEQFLRELGNNQ